MNRRTFLQSTAALSALALFSGSARATFTAPGRRRPLKKGFMFSTLRVDRERPPSVLERFQLLGAAGFDGVEVMSPMDQREVLAAQETTGLEIPSVVISTHWSHPLSHPNPANRQVTVDALRQGLRDARAYGAKSVLLVPAVVNQETSYAEAYTRSAAEIAKVVPLAEELGVAIAIENVWNHFLLSPLEAAAYVDAFGSPMVRWHFDVGNVVTYGWPEQWIRTLGSRIVHVHAKEYSRKLRDEKGPRAGFDVDLLEGDSGWPNVMAALDGIHYSGWLTVEQTYRKPAQSDAQWLGQLAQALDTIIDL
jgi:L-ribulose-5-phosphate 3-epimerase